MEPNFSLSPGGAVGSAVVDQLARTKGWTRFFSILMWIGVVLLFLGGALMVFVGIVLPSASNQVEQQLGSGGAIAVGVIYFFGSFFYIYPALKLGSYSSRITDLMNSPHEANLVAVLNEQRVFWKYVGILTMVMFVLNIIGVVVMIIVGVATTAAGTAGMS